MAVKSKKEMLEKGKTSSRTNRKWRVLDNPRVSGSTRTIFEDLGTDNEELEELLEDPTDEELAENFTERWKAIVDPYVAYKSFQGVHTGFTPPQALKLVRKFYIKYVLDEGWTELKYSKVLDEIFKRKLMLKEEDFKRWGMLYDRRNR